MVLALFRGSLTGGGGGYYPWIGGLFLLGGLTAGYSGLKIWALDYVSTSQE